MRFWTVTLVLSAAFLTLPPVLVAGNAPLLQSSSDAPLLEHMQSRADYADRHIERATHTPHAATGSIPLDYRGSAVWWGTWGMDRVGNLSYLAMTYGLAIIDATDPANPFWKSQLYFEGGPATTVAVSGNYAYLAMADATLQVIDVSNPDLPVPVGAINTPGYVRSIDFAGSYAYVAVGTELLILDLADPTSPQTAGSYAVSSSAGAVAVSGSTAYVADYSNGLVVVDVSDPSQPAFAGKLDVSGNVDGLDVSGTYVFMCRHTNATFDDEFLVVDVSNPATPTLVASQCVATGDYVTIDGSLAYLSGSNLQIVDVTNPTAPQYLGVTLLSGTSFDIEVDGSDVFLAHIGRGLQIFDATDPSAPTVQGESGSEMWWTRGVALRNDRAYTLGSKDVGIINITDPQSPYLSGHFTGVPGSFPRDLVTQGDFLYLADSDSGLIILDLADPDTPVLAGRWASPGLAAGIAVSGTHAYIAEHAQGLHVIDVSSAALPVAVGSYPTPGVANQVTVRGSYAYVADGEAGLQIVDVSNPASPQLAGTYATPDEVDFVYTDANYVYLLGGDLGLQIVDASNPSNPVLLGQFNTPGNTARNLTIKDGLAFITLNGNGLQVVNVTDPAWPFEVCRLGTAEGPIDVAVDDNWNVYIADEYGFLVYQLGSASIVMGDANWDDVLTASDAIYIVNYVFKSGPPPMPSEAAGDTNCNGQVTSSDIIELVDHLFKSGPAPACP